MSARNAAIQKGLFWLAMMAGAVLVASQFACDRPQSAPSTAKPSPVDRLPVPPQETSRVLQPDTITPDHWWGLPRRTVKAKATARIQ